MKNYVKSIQSRSKKLINFLAWEFRKRNQVIEKKYVSAYLRCNRIRKLNIGCGGKRLSGWLNSNYQSRREGVIFLDATKRFPIADGEIDYIYSEHMIEHIPHGKGIDMLKECYRVMREGGVIRISTPDLMFLIKIYGNNRTKIEQKYIEWSMAAIPCCVKSCDDTFVINNYVRDWGHQFIYDEKTLQVSLEYVGFTNVKRKEFNISKYDALSNLESEDRMPEGFLQLESLIIEGVKPRLSDSESTF